MRLALIQDIQDSTQGARVDIHQITTAYDQLKLAQKNLNTFLESQLDPASRQLLSDVLSHVIRAQDTLLGLREALVSRDFEHRLPA